MSETSHVEVDFLADNEIVPPQEEDAHRRPKIPIIIVLRLWYSGQDNIQIQRLYLL